MFEDYALPILKDIIGSAAPDRECRIYHVVGMGESTVEEVIGLSLDARGDIEVGYCARPNEVDLRLIASPAILDEVEPLVREVLGKHIVSQSGKSIEQVVVEKLIETSQTLSLAESCTGGFLAHRITNVPGASEIFPAGYVTYANEAKERELHVPAELLRLVGAVSEEVARAMAEGVRREANTDFGIGITGIAGPGGGTAEKPVGTVFIALAQKDRPAECLRATFPTDRETFKQLATQSALDMLRLRLFA
jgi:nicotinamide-nucleotide amidase